MVVEAVQSYKKNEGYFGPAARGTVVGAAAGIAAKYLLPLTSEECSCDEYVSMAKRLKPEGAKFEPNNKLLMELYHLYVKSSRPLGMFAVAGAIVGTFVGIAHKALKTDIKPLEEINL